MKCSNFHELNQFKIEFHFLLIARCQTYSLLIMTVSATQHILKEVDGSATFEFSSTRVICSVTGPIEVSRPRNEQPTKAHLSLSVRPATGVPTTREAYMEQKLEKIISPMINMEEYPSKEIQIVVQVLETGEREQFTCMELAGAVNSLYLALLSAGISLKASFLSSFCACRDDSLIIRPKKHELDASTSHHVSVFSIIDGQASELLYSDSLGKTNEKEIFAALHAISDDVNKMNDTVRETILHSVADDYVWKF